MEVKLGGKKKGLGIWILQTEKVSLTPRDFWGLCWLGFGQLSPS